MKNNLIIGNTSQLSYYFPDNYIKIPSRNINFEQYKDEAFDRVYITFAEQRTFIENNEKLFTDINVDYTIKIIDFFKDKCNKVIYYSTCELWNNYEGPVDLTLKYNYNYSPYIRSKDLMGSYIKKNYNNVIIMYPFNFNSPYRKKGFLFSKIFDSIINEEKIEIGNTYFYRDIVHPKYIVEKSILASQDEIIGSGRLIYINDFIRILYEKFNLNYDEMVIEKFNHNLLVKRRIFYLNSNNHLYKKIVEDTTHDIKKFKNTIS